MADHPGSHNKPTGGPIKERSSAGSNSTHRTKTGSKRPRSFDPKNTGGGGGGGRPSVTKRYSPAGSSPNTPSGPSTPRK